MKKTKKDKHDVVATVSSKLQEETVAKSVRKRRTITLRTFLIIAISAFIVLAFFAHTVSYFPIDLVITRAVQSFHPAWFDLLMKMTSFIGYPPQVDIFVVVVVIFMYLLGLRFESMVALCNAIFITLINLVLKELVGRPRPSADLVQVFNHVGQTSFPSGHVMFYLAFFGYFWFLSYTMLKKSWLKYCLLFILTAVIILIAPSRIYLGAHWASDVFGAYLFSNIWLLLVVEFHHWGKSRFFVKQPVAPEK
ncbi:MAG: phosphatase PAP2 family protein [Candidatus Levyibacteriota bacterium]